MLMTMIERRLAKRLRTIFAEEGEAAFRELEAAVVGALSRKRREVVALGGGAVLREENRRRFGRAGPVVWLTASVETILERLAADETTAQPAAEFDARRRPGRN